MPNERSDQKANNGIVCIGQPMKHVEAIIVDDTSNPLDTHSKGELCLAGKLLTTGYWNDETKNKEAFFTHNNTIYYRTGDIAYKDEEGDFIFCGRKDHQVKVQGFRVELSEIEHHATLFKGVEQAIVIDSKDETGNTLLYLFLKAKPIEQKEIMDFLKTKLPPYMLPHKIIFIAEIPLNINGKADRKLLKQQYVDTLT